MQARAARNSMRRQACCLVGTEREHGAAAVEFALIVIPLLLVVFAIVNFGLIFSAQLVLNNAARDASRYGVVQGLNNASLDCQTIANYARTIGTPPGAAPVDVHVAVSSYTGAQACDLARGSTAVSGSASSHPCSGSGSDPAAERPLTVTLRYDYRSIVPLVPPYSTTLTATGSFRCEYTS